MISWVIWLILGLLVLFGIIAIIVAKKNARKPTDYYALFVMGAIWFPIGLFMLFMDKGNSIGFLFAALGFIYFVMGLAHKKEWKKNHKTWKQLNKKEIKFKITIMVILGLVVLAGLVVFCLLRKGII